MNSAGIKKEATQLNRTKAIVTLELMYEMKQVAKTSIAGGFCGAIVGLIVGGIKGDVSGALIGLLIGIGIGVIEAGVVSYIAITLLNSTNEDRQRQRLLIGGSVGLSFMAIYGATDPMVTGIFGVVSGLIYGAAVGILFGAVIVAISDTIVWHKTKSVPYVILGIIAGGILGGIDGIIYGAIGDGVSGAISSAFTVGIIGAIVVATLGVLIAILRFIVNEFPKSEQKAGQSSL